MTEFEFILLTLFLVFFIIFITNKIISKRNRQKKIIPKDEKISGNLNNLDKIVEGVSKKNNSVPAEDYPNDELEEQIPDEQRTQKSKSKKNKNKSKKINLKDSIIANEIIKKKFKS